MKNAIAWADHLPEPYKSNMKKAVIKMELYGSLKDAILSSFSWSRSSLGYDYWLKVLSNLDDIVKGKKKSKMELNWKPLTRENLPKISTLLLVRRGDLQGLYMFKAYSNSYLYLKCLSKGTVFELPIGKWVTINGDIHNHAIFTADMYKGTEISLLK